MHETERRDAGERPARWLYGTELDADTIGDLVERRAELGDKPLVWVGQDSVSFAQAHERSNRIANALAERGIGKGDVVAAFLYNSPDHVCLWFACAKLGAIWAPTNVSFIDRDLVYALGDSGARAIVVDEELLDAYLAVRGEVEQPMIEILRGDSSTAGSHGLVHWDELLAGDPARPDVAVSPSDPMAIMYTGGSTGMPKGVLVPHLYYFANALRYRHAANPTPADVHFAIGHLFHSGGQLLGVMGPLYGEMTTVLAKWFSASRYWDRAREHGATLIDPIGPIISAVLLQDPRADDRDHSVRLGIGVATGQIRRELRDEFERRFDVPLLEVYAQAETGVILTTELLDDRRGSNGRPRDWVDVRIVDDEGFPAPPNQIGQITLRMRDPHCFMLEYWRKPEQTVAAWRNLWFHTGDVGYLDDDGYLYFTGRLAHWIRRRGENVSSFEVEQTLGEHPAVADCAAVGVPAELGDEDIKVYVQLVRGTEGPTADELVEFCAARVAYFKVPRYVEFVDALPRSTAKQEIERHKLRDRGIGDAWDRDARAGGAAVGHSHAATATNSE
jgi:carnitine-CoA ligase